MRHTRSAVVAGIAVAALALVAGCSSSGGTASSSTDKVDLKFWMLTLEPSQKPIMDKIIADFEAANPGVTVTLEERAIDAHKEALRQVAGTNAGPDIYRYWEGPGLSGELISAGTSLDLASYYDKYKWNDRFTSAALAGITQYGGYNGVPFTLQGEALYYNKTLFSQAGITAPTTYDELIKDADALVAKGITPIEFGGTVNWHVMRLLDSLIETTCGAATADTLNTTQKGWDTEPCVTQAFTELKTWGDKYINTGFMGMSDADAQQLFYTGKAAMALEGTWFDGMLTDNGVNPDDIGIVPFPTGTDRLYGFGEALYIGKASAHPDQAAAFLDYFTSETAQKEASGAWAAMSVNKDVAPAATNPLDALWPTIFSNASGLYVNNDQNLSLDETTEYWRIQNSVLTGDIAPADAGAQFQKFVDSK